MRERGDKTMEGIGMGCSAKTRESRWRATTFLEFDRELQVTISQWQQSELSSHESRLEREYCVEELILSKREDLKWRRASF
jgi:hypothetical protein